MRPPKNSLVLNYKFTKLYTNFRSRWSQVFLRCFLVGFQDIGYKGEIGYQTFLYSNEPEIRSLLMFLVEKLPRERAETSDQPAGTESPIPSTLSERTQQFFLLIGDSSRFPSMIRDHFSCRDLWKRLA